MTSVLHLKQAQASFDPKHLRLQLAEKLLVLNVYNSLQGGTFKLIFAKVRSVLHD